MIKIEFQKEKYEAELQLNSEKLSIIEVKLIQIDNWFYKVVYTLYAIFWKIFLMKKIKLKHRKYLRRIEKIKLFTLAMAGESLIKKITTKLGQTFFLIIVGIIIVFPFYWMLITSFKSFDEIDPTLKETLLPKHWTLEAYKKMFEYVDSAGSRYKISLLTFFSNSFIVSSISTVCEVIVSLIAGFALYNWKTKMNPLFMFIMFALIMIPGESLLLGQFIFAVNIGWKDNILALIVPFVGNVFTIYLMSNAFKNLGKDVKSASKIDGLSTLKFFIKIAIPAIAPIIVTTAIISFISSWNSILWPVTIMKHGSSWSTVPMLLYEIINITGGELDPNGTIAQNPINVKMAACVMSILPILVLFILFNKVIIKNLSKRSVGGTKG